MDGHVCLWNLVGLGVDFVIARGGGLDLPQEGFDCHCLVALVDVQSPASGVLFLSSFFSFLRLIFSLKFILFLSLIILDLIFRF